MNKSDLLKMLRTERERFESALAAVPAERMEEASLHGGWSVKDVLAHVAYWEQRAFYLLSTLMSGKTPEGIPASDIDALNAKVYADNRALPLEKVRVNEQQAYLNLRDQVERASEEDLFDGTRYAWTNGNPFVGWIAGNTYEHWEEHVLAIQSWLDGAA